MRGDTAHKLTAAQSSLQKISLANLSIFLVWPGKFVNAEWIGAEAAAIKAVLEKNVSDYPHRERYLAWPGPNSNTFASWVLRRAGIRHRMGWRALGKGYPVA